MTTETAPLQSPARYSLSAMLADSGLLPHWLVLRASAGLAAGVGALLALLMSDWRPGASFGLAGVWSTAFLASLILIAVGLGPVPADKAFAADIAELRRKARRKVAYFAIAAKIVLFLAGSVAAFAVAAAIYRARAAEEAGLPVGSATGFGAAIVYPALAGIHVLPATAWLYWMARRMALAGFNPRPASERAPGSAAPKAAK